MSFDPFGADTDGQFALFIAVVGSGAVLVVLLFVAILLGIASLLI